MAREGPAVAAHAVDPAAGVAYALVSRALRLLHGPYVLECTGLRTGAVRKGPVFPAGGVVLVNSVVVASGYLWVSRIPPGTARPVVSQVDPRSLAIIRSFRLPTAPAFYPQIAVAAGPAGSVWIGSFQTLLRIDPATGSVLASLKLPPHLTVSDISVDPAHRHLYVSMAHVVRGGVEGNLVAEYTAQSGRWIAVAATGLVTDSVAGSALTAVPGGVWVSFRTGMLGLTIHLRQRDLAMVSPPGPGVALTPANGIFHWAMSATTLYGGGALWLANEGGIVACLNPRTGKVRAIERMPQPRGTIDPLAASRASGQVFAAGDHGLVQVTPPQQCWP